MSQKFHLGDILSVTTGRLLSPQGMDGLYAILNHMTGDSVYTHQIPRFIDECKPSLIKAMPWLAHIDDTGVADWEVWLQQQVTQYGEYHEVSPLHERGHAVIGPVEELRGMGVHEDKIIILGDERPS